MNAESPELRREQRRYVPAIRTTKGRSVELARLHAILPHRETEMHT